MTDVTIRPMGNADVPVAKKMIGQLQEFLRKSQPMRLPWSQMESVYWPSMMAMVETRDGFMYVAERKGRSVGVINGWVETEKDLAYPHAFWTFGFVKDFFVADLERGQGVGKALLGAAVAFCKERKLPRLSVNIFPDEPVLTYYNRYGFHEGLRRMDLMLDGLN